VYDSRFARASLHWFESHESLHTQGPVASRRPLRGQGADKVAGLRDIFSEYGLIRFRVLVEVRWLQALADEKDIPDDAERVKKFEATTNHDVKAVEYFIREKLGDGPDTSVLRDFLHFGCTSEDINNLAYALMLRTARSEVLMPQMRVVKARLQAMAKQNADVAMLSRTHGQAASPTTLGKEIANFVKRLESAQRHLGAVLIRGKFNGAVGNFNAHLVTYPDADWRAISERFIDALGLDPNSHTTQIEPHDWTAEYAHAVSRYNTILIDLCRDFWSYISLGYFRQKVARDEVGSSTMPHKVNPIDFENAEGNLGMANAMLGHFAEKLPISRWQRDLTDSTVQRNFGVALGYVVIALASAVKGMDKLQVNRDALQADIAEAWELLAEAVQTVMRRYGIPEPYEKLKALTRGQAVTRELIHGFIETLDIPASEKTRLLALTPESYLGLAADLARDC
jgi:adenylosuccinate lyase